MPTPLKDELDESVVADLAARLTSSAGADFDSVSFTATINETLHDLELKDRVNLIADTIQAELKLDYPAALDVLVDVARDNINQWAAWPLCSVIERHGLDHPTESLAAMEHLTKAWTCEFAIRPFLDQHLELTRGFLRTWTASTNEHVRRLPSEGTRPLLPWGPKVAAITADPTIGIEFLDALRDDETELVRRSVANHLNDIAKSHPDLVVETLIRWADSDRPMDDKHVRHSLRTLVKKGHPGALQLLGFTTDPQIQIGGFTCTPEEVELGQHIELATTITSVSTEDQLLVIDFVVHHQTSRGTPSPKVFKWKTVSLTPGESISITKRRLIKNASTRTYYAGRHQVDLQIAGHMMTSTSFDLAI